MFGHEKFKGYQHAIRFVALVSPMLEQFPRGNALLVDQLKRASISIPLNIAEGSGKTSEREKLRFYSIARGSTMECAAILDVLLCSGAISNSQAQQLKSLMSEMAGILSKICLQK